MTPPPRYSVTPLPGCAARPAPWVDARYWAIERAPEPEEPEPVRTWPRARPWWEKRPSLRRGPSTTLAD
jgi:hypothetical protein